MIKLLKPLELLKEVQKDMGDDIYIVGSALRDTLMKIETNKVNVFVKKDVVKAARAFSMGWEKSSMRQKSPRDFLVIKEDHPEFHFHQMTTSDIKDDLANSDFTINAIAITLDNFYKDKKEDIVDPYRGLQDMESKTLRIVSKDALLRTPLNLLRAIRLMAELDLVEMDQQTQDIIRDNAQILDGFVSEESTKELFRILGNPNSSYYLNLMDRHLGILNKIFPEIDPMKEVGECKYHVVDALTHSIYTLKIAENVIKSKNFFEDHVSKAYDIHMSQNFGENRTRLLLCKLGAFFHDVGKPKARWIDDTGRTRFRGHEIVGGEILLEMGRRLGLSEEESIIMSKYSLLHMGPLVIYKNNDVSGNTLYSMFSEWKEETLDILLIGYADIVATRKLLDPDEEMGMFKVHVEYIANNYLTRYLPARQAIQNISDEEIKKVTELTLEEDIEKLKNEIEKMIYMGQMSHKKEKILDYIKEKNQK